ncbi:MAG: PAS domain S-box protein [Ktedonobacteraceae bacterium]
MLGDSTSPLLWNSSGASLDAQALAVWSAYTGQDERGADNWGWLNALHPADRASVREAWQQVEHGPHVFSLVYRIQQGKAEYHPFKVLNVPVFNDAQQLQGWLVFFGAAAAPSPVRDEHWELRLINSMIYTQMVLGILWLSLDGIVLRVNNRLCQFTGYTEAELLSRTLWQLSMPEDVHVQLQAMRERLVRDQSYPPFHIRYRRKDGTPIWVRITEFLVHLPSGEPYYFFYVVEDVNSEVQAEEEHAELLTRVQEAHAESLARTRQLEAIFESITDGILVYDSDGCTIQANAAAEHIFRLDLYPDFRQSSLQDVTSVLQAFDEKGHRFSPEQWPLMRLLNGEDLRGNNVVEMRLVFPDGAEVYLSYSGSPLRGQDEHITGAVMVIRDVTERRRMEHRVHNSFKTLLALAEKIVDIPQCSSTNSMEGQPDLRHVPPVLPFQAVSEYLVELIYPMLEYQSVSISLRNSETGQFQLAALASPSEEERVSYEEHFAEFALSEYLDEPAIALLYANEIIVREIHFSTPRPFCYQILLAPMIMDGLLVGIFTVKKSELNTIYTEDEVSLVKAVAKFVLLVIERERMQQEWIEAHTNELALRETNRRFDEFLSIASHELRTPLAGIKGNIQLAQRRLAFLKEPELPEKDVLLEKLGKVRDYLLHAEHRVNVQNRMISDLLDVSRIQANKLDLVLHPCNLAEIVHNAVEDQRYTATERVITFTVPANEDFTIVGDADRLGQVVHNYLTNALKYSPMDRPVAVSLEILDSTARVSVRDEGPGLSPEEQKHVWERFYRVKGIPVQGEAPPGLGLGLHICRTILDAHHGSFGLESVPGEGSTFWFALPLACSSTDTSSLETRGDFTAQTCFDV